MMQYPAMATMASPTTRSVLESNPVVATGEAMAVTVRTSGTGTQA